MKPIIFQQSDYKAYVLARLDGEAGLGKGARARLCTAMSCHASFLSQVLKGHAHLSLEQADAVSRFLGHDEDESEFFLWLVQNARAGTPSFRAYTKKQLDKIRTRRQSLKGRLALKDELSREHQIKYYSSWIYAAVHVATTIPQLRTPDAIARSLGLELAQVSGVLDFLVTSGAVQRQGAQYHPTKTRIHLGADDDLTSRYHLNWRLKSMQSIERKLSENLHYSSVVTLSADDVEKVREILLQAIETIKAVVRDSPGEKIQCFSLDWFGL